MKLKANLKLPLSIQAADEFGNPTEAAFDAPPSWNSSDESVVAISVAEDGLSAEVQSPAGNLASATVQVFGSVGGKQVLGSLEVEIVSGDVALISIVPGTPVDNDFEPGPAPEPEPEPEPEV